MSNVSKSEVIRTILREIGADKGQCPVNMVTLVKSKLEKRGIKVTTPLIYQMRAQLLKRHAKDQAKPLRRRPAKRPKAAPTEAGLAEALPQIRQPKPESVTVEHLIAIKSLVSKLGGLASFRKAVDTFESLVGPSGPWPFPSS